MTALAHSLDRELHDSSMQPELRVGGVQLLDELADPWNRLCREAKAEPFLSPEWIRCYLQAFEPDTEIIVIAVLSGARMLAVLPLTRKRIWYRGLPLIELKGAANAHSVWFDILCIPGPDGEDALQRIWSYLRDLPGWHVLQLPYTPENGVATEFRALSERDGFLTVLDKCDESPFVPLSPGTNEKVNILAGTTSHFRQHLRRFGRLLENELGVKPKYVRRTVINEEALGEFFRLEGAGWKGRNATSILAGAATQQFYSRIARLNIHGVSVSLSSLSVNDRRIAACFGVESGQVFHILKAAHDETLRRCGPGHLFTEALLKDCAYRGLREMSFGGKAEEYKMHWTANVRRTFNIFMFKRSLLARVAFFERRHLFPVLRRVLAANAPLAARKAPRGHRRRTLSESSLARFDRRPQIPLPLSLLPTSF
jgi:CelD/BcsL family acetyltransferase involved in cellulose biosynthesis